MSCDFHEWSAAYVLGSLSPAERTDYERHLAGCDECAGAVRQLAGLPGLLAKVPPDVLETPPAGGDRPVPDTLLPALVDAARRDQRRRSVRLLAAAAAAAVVVAGGSAAVAATVAHDDSARSTTPPAATAPDIADPLRLMPVGPGSSTGWVSLTPVAWGTRLDLTCEYDSPYGGHAAYAYALVVTTTDGRTEQVATWKALPGKELHVTGATAATPDDIAEVEVVDSEGDAVLRLAQ